MRTWFRVFASILGPLLAVLKAVVLYAQERNPMNFDQWALLLVILVSSAYGIYELTALLKRLLRRVSELEMRPALSRETITQLIYSTTAPMSQKVNELEARSRT